MIWGDCKNTNNIFIYNNCEFGWKRRKRAGNQLIGGEEGDGGA